MRVALSQIAQTIDYGVTASACTEPAGPRFLRITDIQDGTVNWDTVPWCECSEKELKSSKVHPGDIVFARTGATTGKSYLIKDCPESTVFASYLIRVRLGQKADPCYVSHFFQTADYWNQITKGARGAAQPGVNASTLKTLQIPLPPLAEQKRIAAILDAADALRAKRRESLAQLDTLLQTTFLDMFGDPVSNSKQLPLVLLGDLGNWRSGGTPPRSNSNYFKGDVPWFSSGELNGLYVTCSKENVSQEAIHKTSVKAVPRNALMLGMYDTAALKASIAGCACSCNQAIAFSEINTTKANVLYVYCAISIGRDEFRRLQRGVRQKNLNLTMVKQIPIPLPPLDLQQRFATIVASVEQQKARLRDHLAELDTLFASLQQRAFNGKL